MDAGTETSRLRTGDQAVLVQPPATLAPAVKARIEAEIAFREALCLQIEEESDWAAALGESQRKLRKRWKWNLARLRKLRARLAAGPHAWEPRKIEHPNPEAGPGVEPDPGQDWTYRAVRP